MPRFKIEITIDQVGIDFVLKVENPYGDYYEEMFNDETVAEAKALEQLKDIVQTMDDLLNENML